MPKKIGSKEGPANTPPDIDALMDAVESGILAAHAPKKTVPDALVPGKTAPTETEVEAYITTLDEQRLVTPYQQGNKEDRDSATKEIAANARVAGRTEKDNPLILKPEIGDVDETETDLGTSPEAFDRQQRIFDELNRQRDAWIARIQAAVSKKEFDALTNEAAVNGKYLSDRAPGFVVGKALFQLLEQHGIADKAEIESIKQEAFRIQEAIAAIYLTKKMEIYPTKPDTGKKKPAGSLQPVAPVSPNPTPAIVAPAMSVTQASISDASVPITKTEELVPTVLSASDGTTFEVPTIEKADTVRYQAKDGAVYLITRPFGKYRIQVEGEKKVVNISKKSLVERGETEGWILAETNIPQPSEPVPTGTLSPEPLATDVVDRTGRIEPTLDELPKQDPAQPAVSSPEAVLAVAAIETPAVVADTTKPEAVPGMAELDAQIAKLRDEVTENRAAFIATEESEQDAWQRLKKIFRNLTPKESDRSDAAKYRAWYDEKILALQAAELEKLKRSGLPIKELRPEMAALIREFEFDEAERIYDARREMRLSKTNQPLLEKMKQLWGEAEQGINGPTARGEAKAWIKLFAGGAGSDCWVGRQGNRKAGCGQ